MNLTREQLFEVPCITCDAKAGESCTTSGKPLIGFHKERLKLREKYPVIASADKLDATDKALIVYYAFVIVCDSLSTKSLEVFGKQLSSEDIQRFFGHKAIEELRKDGLLGSPTQDSEVQELLPNRKPVSLS